MVVVVEDLVEEEEDPHTAQREEVGAVLLPGESYRRLWCVFRVSSHDATVKTQMYDTPLIFVFLGVLAFCPEICLE